MGCSQSKAPATPAARTARVESARESLDGRSWAAHASYELPPEDRRAGPPPSRPSAVGVCEHFRDAPTPTPAFGLGLPARDTPPGETSRLEFEDRGVVHADRRGAVAVPRPPRRPGARVCSPWFTLPAPPRPRLRPRSSPTIPARASARFRPSRRPRVSSSTRSIDSSGDADFSLGRVRCTRVSPRPRLSRQRLSRPRPGPRLSRPRPGPTLGGQRLFQFCRRSRRRRRMRTTHARAPCRPGRGRPRAVRRQSRTTQKKSRRVRRRRRRPTGRRALVRVHTRHTRVRSRRRETRRRRERRGGGFEPTRT